MSGSRLPFAATFVVEGSFVLTGKQQLLWLKHYALDQGDGCWESARSMGDRIGVNADVVDRYRRLLTSYGLLAKGEAKGRLMSYFVTMPAGTTPKQGAKRDQIGNFRNALDDHLRVIIERAKPPTNGAEIPPTDRAEVSEPSSRAFARGEGGKGGGAPSSLESVSSTLPPPSMEDGVAISPPERGDEVPRAPAKEEGAVQSERVEGGVVHTSAVPRESFEEKKARMVAGFRSMKEKVS